MEKAEVLILTNIKRELDKRRWSPKDLADATGITRSGIYKILDGERFPGPDNLDRIAKAFNCTVSDLFQGEAAAQKEAGFPRDLLQMIAAADDVKLSMIRDLLDSDPDEDGDVLESEVDEFLREKRKKR